LSHIELITIPELAAPAGYAHVAVATGARLVITAGGVPRDAEGRLVGAGDVRAQAQQVIDNLMQQLAAGGASGADVLKTTVYVVSTDHDELDAVWDVVQASPLAPAASTLLGVAQLGVIGQLVEIEAIAALP
jgi:enamine deaminase RidA (YjgF/YER057c/UK114 family)